MNAVKFQIDLQETSKQERKSCLNKTKGGGRGVCCIILTLYIQ